MTHQADLVSSLTLYLPGLPQLPDFFSRLLARADVLPAPSSEGLERHMALFGVRRDSGQDLPVAAISRVADTGIIDNEWWIRADPVHLSPQRDGLVLHDRPGLTPEESRQLAAELNESLAAEGWLLKAPHPERWYLKPANAPRLTTTTLGLAIGQNVHSLLPQGEDRQLWHTRLNELQILMHTSPVNAARESHGHLTANSVWFWGGGRLPQLEPATWSAIYADDPVTIGLARLAGVPVHPPADISTSKPHTGRSLMVLSLHSGGEAANQALQAVVTAVEQGHYRSLIVQRGAGETYRYLRWHRWRFWRRPHTRPMPEHA